MTKSQHHIPGTPAKPLIKSVAMTLWALASVSCGKYDIVGMFAQQSASSEERFAQSLEYNRIVGGIEIKTAGDEYGICVFTDSHTEESNHAAITSLDSLTALSLRHQDSLTAVICLGDMINGMGSWDCFQQHIAPLSGAMPFFTTAGNHDLFFGQWDEYRERFGTSTYTITVLTPGHCDLLIILDSGNATLGKSQREWLETTLQNATAIIDHDASDYRHIIVFTHTNFFKTDTKPSLSAEYALEEKYDLMDTFSRYGVELVLSGHSHRQSITTFRSVRYATLGALKDGSCATLDISSNIRIHNLNINPAEE